MSNHSKRADYIGGSMLKMIMPIPPGRTIAEQLEVKGMSRYEFGILTCWLDDYIDRMLEGKEGITVHVAYKLEEVLGIPAQFWLNLEEIYRKKQIALIEKLQKEVNDNAREMHKLRTLQRRKVR